MKPDRNSEIELNGRALPRIPGETEEQLKILRCSFGHHFRNRRQRTWIEEDVLFVCIEFIARFDASIQGLLQPVDPFGERHLREFSLASKIPQ